MMDYEWIIQNIIKIFNSKKQVSFKSVIKNHFNYTSKRKFKIQKEFAVKGLQHVYQIKSKILTSIYITIAF